ncbi:hypothetical protein [Microvirga aerophila]|nr:hypothetical protein [Microvirga aerophila]
MYAMIWARKTSGLSEWDNLQEQFEELFTKLGCPRQMMLIAGAPAVASQIDLFISLPYSGLLSIFYEFDQISESELPLEAPLLVGHDDAFRVRFKFPRQGLVT